MKETKCFPQPIEQISSDNNHNFASLMLNPCLAYELISCIEKSIFR